MTGYTSLVNIPGEGEAPRVQLPVPRTVWFDVSIDLLLNSTELGNASSASLQTLDGAVYPGDIVIQDDPNVAEIEGSVALYFSQVPYIPGDYALTMSWDSNAYHFDPTDMAGFGWEPMSPPHRAGADQLNKQRRRLSNRYHGSAGSRQESPRPRTRRRRRGRRNCQ